MSVPVPPEEAIPAASIPQFSTPTRYIIGVLLLVFGIFCLLVIRPVLTTLLFAFIIAFVLYLPARALHTHTRLSYAAAVIFIYAIIVLVLLIAFFTLLPAVIDGVNSLVDELQVAEEEVTEWMLEYEPGDAVVTIAGREIDLDPIVQAVMPLFVGRPDDLSDTEAVDSTGTEAVDDPNATATTPEDEPAMEMPNLGSIFGAIGDVAGALSEAVIDIFTDVAGFVAALGVALFVSFLALLDLGGSRGGVLTVINSRFEREVKILLARLDQIWLGFFKSQVLIAILLGVLAYIQYILLGVPGALPLAIFNGFFSVIPTVGGIISIIPQVIVTLLLGSTRFPEMDHVTFTLINVIIQTIYSQIIYNAVSPMIVGKSVKLPVVVVIVGVLIGLSLGGIIGAFLVVPVISTIKLLFGYFIAKVGMQEPFPGEEVPKTIGFFGQLASSKPKSSG